IFIFLISLVKFGLTPRPFGEWVQNEDKENVIRFRFADAHRRNPMHWFFNRNMLYSKQALMPDGLLFRFRREKIITRRSDGLLVYSFEKIITVQPVGRASLNWRRSDGSKLQPQFQVVHELKFRSD